MEIHGTCDEKFSSVFEAFEKNFTEYGDIGACFAATVEGEYVVDIWGGHQDEAKKRPWEKETIINVYSTTKTMTFLCALMLSDRDQLNLDAPVALYWPEFASNNKDNVLVKHLLSHSAGLPGFSRALTNEELFDWEFACNDLAHQQTWWTPGTQAGYHAITQGHLIGEVIRRVTGKSFGQYFNEEVAQKVGADFYVGVDEKDFGRIADLVAAKETLPILEMDPQSIPGRVFAGLDITPATTGSAAWRKAEIPAANGHGNARSVVRAQTALANQGKAFGIELMSEETCAMTLQPQISGNDLVLGLPVTYGLGYALKNEMIPMGPNQNVIWWGGAGGSSIVIDADAHVCCSYVMNQMDNNIVGDPRAVNLGSILFENL